MTDTPRPGMGSEHLADDQLVNNSVGNELASNRTAMALLRSEIASDRTLMAVVRTSLSLISFGFTIFKFFDQMTKSPMADGMPDEAPRRFGITLVGLGIVLLVMGILNHRKTTATLRARRNRLFDLGLIRNTAEVHVSSTMAVAAALLIVGLLAIASILFRQGPF